MNFGFEDFGKRKNNKSYTVSITITAEDVAASSKKEAERMLKNALANAVRNDPAINVGGKVKTR